MRTLVFNEFFECLDGSIVDFSSSIQDHLNDTLEQIGKGHQSWLLDITEIPEFSAGNF